MVSYGDCQSQIFECSVRETTGETKMKNINPSSLPLFHDLILEDLETFLSEFEVICRSYDNASND